jgi:DNA-directed RNA polymerase specialized sigma24 family protein
MTTKRKRLRLTPLRIGANTTRFAGAAINQSLAELGDDTRAPLFDDDRLYTAAEIAKKLGVHVITVWRWVQS